MSINYQRNGSVLFVSDADSRVTQLNAAGLSQAQIDAAYAAFTLANPPPAAPVGPVETYLASLHTWLASQPSAIGLPPAPPSLNGM